MYTSHSGGYMYCKKTSRGCFAPAHPLLWHQVSCTNIRTSPSLVFFKTFENALEVFENALEAFENALEAFENALEAFENALEAFENALKAFENALEAFGYNPHSFKRCH